MSNNRELTAQEKATAARLKSIWLKRRSEWKINQEELAHRMGWRSQGSVTQYINGKIVLNLETGLKFAEVLRVLPSDLNPEWGKYDLGMGEASQEQQKAFSSAHEKLAQELLEVPEDKLGAIQAIIEALKVSK